MSLAQSPVVFSVSSSTLVGQANFQYIGELTIWTGSVSASGSGNTWTLAKYPSSQGFTGIFDLNEVPALTDKMKIPGSAELRKVGKN